MVLCAVAAALAGSMITGCGCELLREHGHLLLILLTAVLLCCVLAARAGRLIAGLAMK